MAEKSGTALDRDEVARRAYEISQSVEAGTPEENWHRAEEELREGRPAPAPKRTRARKKTEDQVGS